MPLIYKIEIQLVLVFMTKRDTIHEKNTYI
jgi:hypothetical protein